MATNKDPDYNKWTKQGLIKRIRLLESEKEQRDDSAIQNGEEETSILEAAAGAVLTDAEPSGEVKLPSKKKKKNGIDLSKYSTRFIALKLAYLGRNYSGYEYSASGRLPSIEEELWKALVKACLISPAIPDEVDFSICEYSKCGRTDRGVSAFGQVIALRVRSNRPPLKRKASALESGTEVRQEKDEAPGQQHAADARIDVSEQPEPLAAADEIQYAKTLNRILPPDIRVLAWCPNPPPAFSARFSCRERQYKYFFTQPAFAPVPSSLENTPLRGQGVMKDGWLDMEAMREAARRFVGVHDFRNFCKVDANKQITNFTRRIFEADITEVEDVRSVLPYVQGAEFKPDSLAGGVYPKVYSFNVRGSAFLWHQIRHMVAILFLVGQGLERPSLVSDLLDIEKHPRKPGYSMAEETPLVLWDCIFPDESTSGKKEALDWVYLGEDNPQNLHGSWGLATDLWRGWHEKKMDEILANRLLDLVTSSQAGLSKTTGHEQKAAYKVYEGGNSPQFTGRYVPVLEKPRLQTPAEMLDKFAQKKGFANSDAMRKAKGWRNGSTAMEDTAMEE